ncbi:DUF6494 family protein [Ferrimonas balearica]|uniref:DUF6494 family protein n=1 Tax=Ferrimonas balearica TaxID=44012 RepID=UPI001C9A0C24|nr:DUF6494 family protein [Ferrimonas balearica]MBY5992281.1 hypothetical protein [Ferrimonas balearica]
MTQEQMDMAIRRFLKEVGITSHRALAEAIAEAEKAGRLAPGAPIKVSMTLQAPELGLEHKLDGTLDLNSPE